METNDADGDAAPPETVPAERQCTNPAAGYTLAYPREWHTNTGEVLPVCSLFHPDDFEVPERTETTGVAISVSREPVAFEFVTGEQPGRRELLEEETTVAEHPAVRLEYVATGEALLPEGTPVYEYLVDLDGETLIATLRGLGSLDFEASKDVLDGMMESLTIRG